MAIFNKKRKKAKVNRNIRLYNLFSRIKNPSSRIKNLFSCILLYFYDSVSRTHHFGTCNNIFLFLEMFEKDALSSSLPITKLFNYIEFLRKCFVVQLQCHVAMEKVVLFFCTCLKNYSKLDIDILTCLLHPHSRVSIYKTNLSIYQRLFQC